MILFIRILEVSEAFEECYWSLPAYTLADRVSMYAMNGSRIGSTSYVLIGVF